MSINTIFVIIIIVSIACIVGFMFLEVSRAPFLDEQGNDIEPDETNAAADWRPFMDDEDDDDDDEGERSTHIK